MSSTHYIEWKPTKFRGYGVFCRNCNCFLAQARNCVNRDDDSFCFKSMDVINIERNDSHGRVMCRCGSSVGTVCENRLLHLTGVMEQYIKNECTNNYSFLLTPIMHFIPTNGFRSCPGCNRVICANSVEVQQYCTYIVMPAYLAPNIKLCNDQIDEDPNSAMCYCGFVVGNFIDDNHLVLDSVYQTTSMDDNNQNGWPYRCDCFEQFQNNNRYDVDFAEDETDDDTVAGSDTDSGMEDDDMNMSVDN